MMTPLEKFLWEEVFRAEVRIARLASRVRDRTVGTELAVSLDGRGNEAADTASVDI